MIDVYRKAVVSGLENVCSRISATVWILKSLKVRVLKVWFPVYIALLNYAKIFRMWGLVEWNYIIGVMPSNGTWGPRPFLSPCSPVQVGWAASFTVCFFPRCTTLSQATGPSDHGLRSLTPWAKINLPSFSSQSSKGFFVIVTKRKLIPRKRHCSLK